MEVISSSLLEASDTASVQPTGAKESAVEMINTEDEGTQRDDTTSRDEDTMDVEEETAKDDADDKLATKQKRTKKGKGNKKVVLDAKSRKRKQSVEPKKVPKTVAATSAGPKKPPSGVVVSVSDSSQHVKITEDGWTVTGAKGYRTAKSSHGVRDGEWFFEITVNEPALPPPYPGFEAHTRLGWCSSRADIEAPVGCDKFGYSYRDIEGTKFHNGCGAAYGLPYTVGDVIGCYIKLPPPKVRLVPQPLPPTTVTSLVSPLPASVSLSGLPTPPPGPSPIPFTRSSTDELYETDGGCIHFFKNGVDQGVAFTDIYEGLYFPAASLYMRACVTFNFGPVFKYPPDSTFLYRPMSDLCATTEKDKANGPSPSHASAGGSGPVNMEDSVTPNSGSNKRPRASL
eukprot:GILJ01006539.1.p1 GENE.GILJ01006539.1~~GILJ01006539.1.p1  ORF type:complete len:414 (-),score=59.97 GILJ01006539.1:13-1209(-)